MADRESGLCPASPLTWVTPWNRQQLLLPQPGLEGDPAVTSEQPPGLPRSGMLQPCFLPLSRLPRSLL